jgi:hypothetical protein
MGTGKLIKHLESIQQQLEAADASQGPADWSITVEYQRWIDELKSSTPPLWKASIVVGFSSLALFVLGALTAHEAFLQFAAQP